jgi:hypothetical protein
MDGHRKLGNILLSDPARWINSKISELPDEAKFRAFNSIRFLNWANTIYNIELPIPACYCALHATEEAVAAFISSAKMSGYGDDAKSINIRDHQAKATVSLIAQKISILLQHYNPAIAVDPKSGILAARFTQNGEHVYRTASLNLVHFLDARNHIASDFFAELVKMFGDIQELKRKITQGQEGRNAIFYASNKGIPAGFNEPEKTIERECKLSLGLIWASIDIHQSKGELLPFVVQAFRTANRTLEELKKKKVE